MCTSCPSSTFSNYASNNAVLYTPPSVTICFKDKDGSLIIPSELFKLCSELGDKSESFKEGHKYVYEVEEEQITVEGMKLYISIAHCIVIAAASPAPNGVRQFSWRCPKCEDMEQLYVQRDIRVQCVHCNSDADWTDIQRPGPQRPVSGLLEFIRWGELEEKVHNETGQTLKQLVDSIDIEGQHHSPIDYAQAYVAAALMDSPVIQGTALGLLERSLVWWRHRRDARFLNEAIKDEDDRLDDEEALKFLKLIEYCHEYRGLTTLAFNGQPIGDDLQLVRTMMAFCAAEAPCLSKSKKNLVEKIAYQELRVILERGPLESRLDFLRGLLPVTASMKQGEVRMMNRKDNHQVPKFDFFDADDNEVETAGRIVQGRVRYNNARNQQMLWGSPPRSDSEYC